jgi:hypothetical protein
MVLPIKISEKTTLHYTIWLGVDAENFGADVSPLTLHPLP